MMQPADETADLPLTQIEVGEGAARRRIAVRARSGIGPPVVWLGGFRSDMRATKALALDAWAAERSRALIRFDYTGHGASGGRFEEATISTWLEDAATVLDRFAEAPPVLVGSSMGGWIACLVAREYARLNMPAPAGLVLIAPALDFTEVLIWQALPPAVREEITRNGVWRYASQYGPDPNPITLRLIEDGRRHLMLDAAIEPRCPVHILQGMDDPDVPYGHALKLVERLTGSGTLLTLIKDGNHRLSRPQDIAVLLRAVETIA